MLILGCLGEPRPYRRAPSDLFDEWSCGWYHNSAAALVEDGAVIAATEEERVTRRKHSGKFPFEAIATCLRERGCTLDDAGAIAFGERGGDGPHRDPRISVARIAELLAGRFEADAAALVPRIRLVEHHLGHAASAFIPSGFRDALIVTSDGFGDGIAGLVMEARGGALGRTLATIPVEHSLGNFYGSLLGYLGYRHGDEYKMMGLAPYGDPARFRSMIGGWYRLDPAGAFAITGAAKRRERELLEAGAPRAPDGAFADHHADLAAAVQEAFERIMFHLLAHHRETTGLRALCLAGGTAQNSTLNGKIADRGMFDRVFVQPASHDAGVALGAALVVSAATPAAVSHVYWGTRTPAPDAVERRLSAWGDLISYERADDVAATTARLLASGEIIGWMQGRAEFGPRALGNRSILADPRPRANRDVVNEMIKMREQFRPFAPAVIAERFAELFVPPAAEVELGFMTFVVQVRPEHRAALGAVTHVDGSARVQTVTRAANPRFHRVIEAFGELTGVPVVLNTSFNANAEPIVDGVDDAVTCFLTTGLDRLVIGDFVIAKRSANALAHLDLVAAPVLDVALVQHRERTPAGRAGRAVFGIVARGLAHAEISRETFAVLAAGGCEPARAIIERQRAVAHADDIARELRLLWAQRLIRLVPRE